jgi:nitroreductase
MKTYGKRGERYVPIDTGHAAENIALQAVALGLATVMVGAFEDKKVSEILELSDELKPMYIIPVGKQG